jgi:hypothetical protein
MEEQPHKCCRSNLFIQHKLLPYSSFLGQMYFLVMFLHIGKRANRKASFLLLSSSLATYNLSCKNHEVKYNKMWSITTIRWKELLQNEGESVQVTLQFYF